MTDTMADMTSTRTVTTDGTVVYHDHQGKRHRDNGPAVEFTNGLIEWWIHGQCCRPDGPALEDPHGYTVWVLPNSNIDSDAATVTTLWLRENRPDASPATRDALIAAAQHWPYRATLAELYTAALAATT